jgi:hypothetical protein
MRLIFDCSCDRQEFHSSTFVDHQALRRNEIGRPHAQQPGLAAVLVNAEHG